MSKFLRILLSLMNKNYLKFIVWRLRFSLIPQFMPSCFEFNKLKVIAPDIPSFMGQYKEIFCYDSYLFSASSRFPVIYDCGANIGTSVLYFKKKMPNSRIIAFEADPNIIKVLKQNLENNNIEEVTVVAAAVWVNDKGITFAVDGADGGSIYGSGHKIVVPSVRLKAYLEQELEIDMLKIDIEGAELEVLQDIAVELPKVKNLFVEYHGFADQPPRLSELLGVLQRAGFRYHMHSASNSKCPFVDKHLLHGMDLQLNIFAYR